MTDRLAEDEELAAAYRRAHEEYLAEREAIGHVPEIDGITAGGMPTRVKCLHVLVGHSLAEGPASTRWATRRSSCSASGGSAMPAARSRYAPVTT